MQPRTSGKVIRKVYSFVVCCQKVVSRLGPTNLNETSSLPMAYLTHIINAFIGNNEFPRLWKVARIFPINKVATPTEKSHFRPIAILSALSKIFERTVCNQLIEFIDKRQLYKDTVTGFMKGFSTGSALLKLRDDIKKAMSASELSIIVLIDFSKAFDTISHDTLIKTLNK